VAQPVQEHGAFENGAMGGLCQETVTAAIGGQAAVLVFVVILIGAWARSAAVSSAPCLSA
jgi:hypothetical protein